jgi:hypothetical protein
LKAFALIITTARRIAPCDGRRNKPRGKSQVEAGSALAASRLAVAVSHEIQKKIASAATIRRGGAKSGIASALMTRGGPQNENPA